MLLLYYSVVKSKDTLFKCTHEILKGTSMSRKNNHQKNFSEKTDQEQELAKLTNYMYREFLP